MLFCLFAYFKSIIPYRDGGAYRDGGDIQLSNFFFNGMAAWSLRELSFHQLDL